MRIQVGKGNMNASEIAKACGGKLVAWGGAQNTNISFVCTDSREATAASLFVAIKGERSDGHDFIANVMESGAAVLCEKISEKIKCSFERGCVIIVDDTLSALGNLAHEYKKSLKIKTVAVTGSVGKTTTKELIASVMSTEMKVGKTVGNHNSLIGMPMSLLEISPDADVAVLEMGMSHLGEIDQMSLEAQPDVAVITNIGTSHLEYLHTRANIAKAKLEIVDGMKDDGVLILNGDEPLLRNLKDVSQKTLYVSAQGDNADFCISNVHHTHTESSFDIFYDGKLCENITLPFVGDHGVMDAAFSFAVGVVMGISEEKIRCGIANFHNTGMRQNIYELGGVSIIEDCYNASPESMRAAVSLLSEYSDSADEKGRKIAFLGDMLELGDDAPELHFELGRYVAQSGIDLLIAFGPISENIARGAVFAGMNEESVFSYADIEAFEIPGAKLLESLAKNDTVLFKASRGIRLERVIEYVKSNGSLLS